MEQSTQLIVLVGIAAAALAFMVVRGPLVAPATSAGKPQIAQALRTAGLTFDVTVGRQERQLVLGAISRARPEAQAVIGVVDGLVDIRVGRLPGQAIGMTTTGGGSERIRMTLDLPTALRRHGSRGIDRLVLHELGHAVDHALVTPELARELDAQIPAGYPCPPHEPTGACAPDGERFAETFAKWALDDIGVGVSIGYKVLPPQVPLEQWGAPLAELARR